MYKQAVSICVGLFLVLCAWGGAAVATVSSAGSFTLRGATINPSEGVPSWPAMSGDAVTSQASPVNIAFHDGSLVVLGAKSKAEISMAGEAPVFELQQGFASYDLKTTSSVKLMALGRVVTPAALVGNYALDSNGQTTAAPSGMTTGTKAALIIAGAGFAGSLGYAISQAVSSGNPVSPSQ